MPALRKSSDRYRSMATYFGALIRDLRDSHELRVGEPLTVSLLASRTGYSPSMIGQIERGESLPETGARVAALDDALQAQGQLKTLWPLVQRLGHRPMDELSAATNTLNPGYREKVPCALTGGDDMERRHLFQLAAWGLLAQSPIFSNGEHIRQMLEQALGTAEEFTADDWEARCANHMYAILNQQPTIVREALYVDLLSVRQKLIGTSPDKAADLQRITAWMSVMYANVLMRLGEYGPSHRWLATARRAADLSRDLDMQVWVRGTAAVFALYSPLPLTTTLTLAEQAQSLAGDRVTPGLLRAVAAEAQVLAVMGRQREAENRLNHLLDLAGQAVAAEEFSWTDDAVWFTASWVYSYGAEAEKAREARDNVLACAPRYQSQVNVQLHEALCVGAGGGYNEALNIATEVMSDLGSAYRTYPMLYTARLVLNAVPLEERRALPALGDYRKAVSTDIRT
ncbi:helix-turn-helix transcriptional regulator [Sphaerisporangium sp. TRM90804]|uniref:helix-turn-helix domain-containing protein n=1 Tax=Sphaerisporangium sp. TRM90804 TaxID=3031113 RepID=UPI00244A54B0|nr:helix-turn-helix transcriptional regulator [Sphaerisporangium sp. TRM90804]MDH2430368.1 helix-turn-helix transcriptional regulator [Sphaerisporangium sp. TRM90804]